MAVAGVDRHATLGAARTGLGIAARRLPVRTVAALQGVLFLLFVANLGRIPVFSTGSRDAPLLANDLGVAALLVVAGLAMAQHRSMHLDGVAFAALAFTASAVTSTALAIPAYGLTGSEVAVSLAYLARWVFYFAIYVVVINAVRASDVAAVWGALEKTILAFALFGIVQVILFPGFAQMVYPESRPYTDWDPQGRRLVSTFLDPNFAGAFILIGFLVQLGMLAAGARMAAWKPVTLFVALVLTLSRSSFLALVIAGLVLVSITGLSRRLLKWGAVLSLMVLAGLPKLLAFAATFNKLTIEDDSATSRLVMWVRGLQVLADNPLMGIGFNTWGYVQERYGWERLGASSYAIEGGLLFIAVLTGVVGLSIYLVILALAAVRGRRVWRNASRTPLERGLGAGAAACTVMIVVHSFFTNSILLPFLMEPLWVVWGLVAVLHADRWAGQEGVAGDRAPSDPLLEGTA